MYLCNEQLTVYNKHTNASKVKEYLPTVITGIHWFGTENVAVTADGLVGAKQYTLRIPIDASFGGKHYVTPKAYQNLKNWDNVFTFDEGDIIVKGSVSDLNSTPSKLQDKYDDVVTVVSVTDNRNAPKGKHWKVVCK